MGKIKRAATRAFVLFLSLLLMLPSVSIVSFADETRTGTVTGDAVNIRNGPGTTYSKIGVQLSTGHSVTVLSEKADANGGSIPWYQISFTYSGTSYTGYIRSDYVRINTAGTDTPPAISDAEFEQQIADFPEEYKPGLRTLHQKHPTWKFVPYHTDLDWSYVQSKENRLGFSFTNSGNRAHYSTAAGCYNWETDTYIVKEGSNWYQAHPDVVAYYMDPRNFLNETDIFQFERLTYSATAHTEQNIAIMLQGTFMAGKTTVNNAGETVSYARAFMDAAISGNVSAFHLVSRCIQEVGSGGTSYSKGTYPGFAGYYNFYNIGAYGGAYDGMVYAKSHGWNTAYKAIYAGGAFIGEEYVARGQNTPYFQKYNVVNKNSVGSHQYMTNVAAARSEGTIQKNKYVKLGMLETAFTFTIPIYWNMPAAPCALPVSVGVSNNYLRDLRVADGAYPLTPTFDFYDSLNNGRTSYSVVVPKGIFSLYVDATPASSQATVTGIGDYFLNDVDTTLTVTCTSAGGVSRHYTIHVTFVEGEDPDTPPDEIVSSGITGDCVWSLDGTVLTISGEGAMGDYSIESSSASMAPWGYSITEVILEPGVTSIGTHAFDGCTALTKITIPNTVETIGDYAFYECNVLESAEIPDSVCAIGEYAFFRCYKLSSIHIPAGVQDINAYAFAGCTTAPTVVIPDGVTAIAENAFNFCAALTTVAIPKSVKTISPYAFVACDALSNVWYEGSLTDRGSISVGGNNTCLTDAEWHYGACVKNTDGFVHVYDSSSDSVCNACGAQRQCVEHVYDNACDATCNACGAVRSVSSHVYDNACDASCNTCGATRTPPHSYDGAEDNACNLCGGERPAYTRGDVDGEEGIDINDAIYLLFAINFPEEYAVNQPMDFDGNGEVEIADAIYLLFHVNFEDDYPLH